MRTKNAFDLWLGRVALILATILMALMLLGAGVVAHALSQLGTDTTVPNSVPIDPWPTPTE